MFSAIFIIGFLTREHLAFKFIIYGAIAFAIGVLAVRAYRRSQSDNFEKRNN